MSDQLPIIDALEKLRAEYPNLNVTKLRFLEGEGKLDPEIGDDGIRRYSVNEIVAALPSSTW